MHCNSIRTNRTVSFSRRLAVLPAVVLLAAMATPAWGAEPVSVEVIENTADSIVIHYELGDFTELPIKIDGQAYTELSLPGESRLQLVGEPAVPHICRSVVIPNDAAMAARVVAEEYYELTDVDVVPSKGPISRSIDPATVPYTFGPVYDADAFYPGAVAELGEPYIMRDIRGAVVTVNPFQYNPVTGVLRVYTSVTVDVSKTGPGRINVLEQHDRDLSLAFHQIYTHHFLNYTPVGRYTPMDETGDMLIICYDSWLTNIQPLVDHKNSIGISTTAVGVSTIGNNSTSIKNYIQGVYDTSDLAFVLLVGDAAQVDTPFADLTSDDGAADPDYTLLAGSDTYPDIILGRFSAQSSSQVDTQVERTVEYEEMPATEQAWFWKGTGIASSQGTGDDGEYDYEHIGYIRDDLLAYGYTQVDQIYDPSATDTQVTNALNAGRGIVNYCGHGSATSWGTTGFNTTDINNLTNDNMLPFIISVACNNGEFDNYTSCFGEAWLRATNGSEPTGAIGCYASSNSMPWDPPMEGQDEINLLYVAEAYDTFGAYCYAGSCSMMDDYPGSSSSWGTGPAAFRTWHIFGDPSLRITGTVQPQTGLAVTPTEDLIAEGPSGGPFTPDSKVYTLENLDDTGMNYTVSKSQSWVSLDNTGGYLAGHATTTVTVSINSGASSLSDGHHGDTVSFVNTTNHDGDTTREVGLDVGEPVVQYSWDMNSDPGWTTAGLWEWGTPTGGGGEYGEEDPTSGHTGSNVYGYNLDGDYTNYMSEMHLTTGAIDCSEMAEVTLKFWRWLGVERPLYDHAYVRVSNDGSNWTTVWENDVEITDSSWSQQEFDISSVADGEATVYLRWTMGTTDGGWRYCGWNIDDVEIWAIGGEQPDTAPPTPDPMSFSSAPAAVDTSAITMTAAEAVDAESGPVEYYFEFVSGGSGGSDSGWQSSRSYTDSGLAPNTEYTYRVRARDSAASPNVTAYSGTASATTAFATIESAASCRDQGAAGEMCADLSASVVEPRVGGVTKMEFEVSTPVSDVSASVDCTYSTYSGTITETATGGTTVTVEFDPSLPNNDCCTITLGGEVDDEQTVAILLGDADGNLDVNSLDYSSVKLHLGLPVDASNCLQDVNADGDITSLDYSTIKLNLGAILPGCP